VIVGMNPYALHEAVDMARCLVVELPRLDQALCQDAYEHERQEGDVIGLVVEFHECLPLLRRSKSPR
jgi:hypothetical protein